VRREGVDLGTKLGAGGALLHQTEFLRVLLTLDHYTTPAFV